MPGFAIWGPQLGRPLVDRIHGSKIGLGLDRARGRHGNERDHEHLKRAIPTEPLSRSSVLEDHGLVRQVGPDHGDTAARPPLDAIQVRVIDNTGDA
jgi:hypothetical protein